MQICVFTKDPQKSYREMFAAEFPRVKVIGISKLRSNYKSFESRRKLAGSYDLFFAEKSIIPLLAPLLGKAFFSRHKFVIDFSAFIF
jgi:ribosome biogenesis protein UTP30